MISRFLRGRRPPVSVNPFTPTIPGESDDEAAPPSGTFVGRFMVLGSLGMGGMALVLSAYDPQLDRKVALKLLRGDLWRGALSDQGREQLVREAQAMARLNHPNVVAVYEVVFEGEAAYVVMEQVDGRTLRAWRAEDERSWEEIVDLLAAAGEGLAAAHEAGLVHHDFKPENVLVGRDGRPRVSDFGLAGAGRPGAGTRQYMAPEQLTDAEVDARADVYAFCVTAWEMLHGERPGVSLPLPAQRHAPRWVYAALARGLAGDVAARWPSMEALLAALRRRRSVAQRAALGAGALLAVAAGAFIVGRLGSAVPLCGADEARLAGVWDAGQKEEVRRAFAATGAPFAADAWDRTSARLDGYARGWAAMHGEACRATRVEGRQSDTLLDLRMACLDERRALFGSLTELWSRGVDPREVATAVEAADNLPSLAECADARALTAREHTPADPAVAARVAAARRSIDAARVLELARRLPQAREVAAAARVEADATGWTQVRAEAALAHANVIARFADRAAAQHYLEATRLGERARDDRLVAAALIRLVNHYALIEQDADRALLVAEIADGVIERIATDDRLRVELFIQRGNALQTAGRYDESRVSYQAARTRALAAFGPHDHDAHLALAELATVVHDQGRYAEARRLGEDGIAGAIELYGDKHPNLASELSNVGRTAERQGDFDGAAQLYRRALAITDEVFGPDSRRSADTLNKFGVLELRRGHLDEAAAMLERAQANLEQALGPDDLAVASTRTNLAIARRKQGRRAEAIALLEQALKVKIAKLGAEHRGVAYPIENLGASAAAAGDFAGAAAHFRRALELRTRVLGAAHAETVATMGLLGGALAALGRCDEAQPLLAVATPGVERAIGPDDPDLAPSLVAGARCDIAGGRAAAAIAPLERAIKILEEGRSPVVERGAARWPLARALWALGRRDEALAAARVADGELAADADGEVDRAALRTWLGRRAVSR